MKPTRIGIARRLVAPAAALFIVAAAVLWHHLPVPTDVYAPFDVRGGLGSPVRGRALAVTATGVRLSPTAKITVGPFVTQTVTATGLWVVVDAAVSATQASMIPSAELLVGANSYQPSTRADASSLNVPVDPGIPQRGSWVFDVAPELLEPLATPLQLRVWTGDGRLDSRVVIDLGRKPPTRVDVVRVKPREVGPA